MTEIAPPACRPLSSAEEQAFSYTCGRCGKCCWDKAIRVGPYEIARLARAFGISGTDFRARFTVHGQGQVLTSTQQGACVFLGSQGCMVHADRPSACRVYPLGVQLSEGGPRRFALVEGHPESHGRVGANGTVLDYLRAQGALPYIEAAEAYLAWLRAAARHEEKKPQIGGGSLPAEALIDLDLCVETRCAELGMECPDDLGERLRLHLRFLHDLLDEGVPGEDGPTAVPAAAPVICSDGDQ